MNKKIGFIGCGKMASAIIGGVISSKFLNTEDITASEHSEEKQIQKQNELGIKVITDNKQLVKESDVIFVATTPNYVADVLNEIKDILNSKKLLVSIAAGVTTEKIEAIVGKSVSFRRDEWSNRRKLCIR